MCTAAWAPECHGGAAFVRPIAGVNIQPSLHGVTDPYARSVLKGKVKAKASLDTPLKPALQTNASRPNAMSSADTFWHFSDADFPAVTQAYRDGRIERLQSRKAEASFYWTDIKNRWAFVGALGGLRRMRNLIFIRYKNPDADVIFSPLAQAAIEAHEKAHLEHYLTMPHAWALLADFVGGGVFSIATHERATDLSALFKGDHYGNAAQPSSKPIWLSYYAGLVSFRYALIHAFKEQGKSARAIRKKQKRYLSPKDLYRLGPILAYIHSLPIDDAHRRKLQCLLCTRPPRQGELPDPKSSKYGRWIHRLEVEAGLSKGTILSWWASDAAATIRRDLRVIRQWLTQNQHQKDTLTLELYLLGSGGVAAF